ncbi:MAG: thiamine-monophosphate kinase [Bacteroidota bacterium]
MYMTNDVSENALVERLVRSFPRSPLQCNRFQESDAELIRLPGTGIIIALTIDGIVEEIEAGLYADPYLIGWMMVVVNASDLAAVGAEPVGILLNETLPRGAADEFIAKLQQGVRDASSMCHLHILGGDTNFSSSVQMSACAVGLVPSGLPVTRLGCKPGDLLFASGQLGLGNAYAFCQLAANENWKQVSLPYQPLARLSEGQLLRSFASCCIDTSDGALAAVDQLMRLNHVGFVLESSLEELLHPDALRLSQAAGIPGWMMLAGPHGEFELLFTVPAERVESFLAYSSMHAWEARKIGRVVDESGIWFFLDGERTAVDTGGIRNLFVEADGSIDGYITGLLSLVRTCKQGRNKS